MKTGACDRESVALLASGALGAGETLKVRRHLRQCESCRAYLEEMSALCDTHTVAAGRLADAEVPPGLYTRVTAAIQDRPPNWWDRLPLTVQSRWPRVAAVAAALLLFAGGAVFFRRPQPPAPVAALPRPEPAPRIEPEAANPSLLTYRLALNRSPEEFDQLLAREAGRADPGPTTWSRMGVTRLNSDL